MKKSLIALAVAATVATPMTASAALVALVGEGEGINIYGSFRPQFVVGGSANEEKIADGGSRWGIKGTHDLGNGLESFYRLERKFSTENAEFPEGGRLAYAGVSGGFGAVAMGQQWTPYYVTIGSPSDIFASNGLSNYNDTGGPFRAGNVISYALPSGMVVGGAVAFVVAGDIVVSDTGVVADDQDGVDAISAGLTFGAGPVSIGLGVHDTSANSRTRIGLSVGADLGPVAALFMIEDTDVNDEDIGQGGTPWAITGSVMGFAVQFASTDADDDDSAVTLGYTHKMSGNTRVQLSWETNDWTDDDKFVARYRVDF